MELSTYFVFGGVMLAVLFFAALGLTRGYMTESEKRQAAKAYARYLNEAYPKMGTKAAARHRKEIVLQRGYYPEERETGELRMIALVLNDYHLGDDKR